MRIDARNRELGLLADSSGKSLVMANRGDFERKYRLEDVADPRKNQVAVIKKEEIKHRGAVQS